MTASTRFLSHVELLLRHGPLSGPAPEFPAAPEKEDMALFAPFEGLERRQVRVARDPASVLAAAREMEGISAFGFDTESKPTFVRGEVNSGPHVAQFATADQAWVFQLRDPAARAAVAALLCSPSILKVGFGLAGDRSLIESRFGAPPQLTLDLDHAFHELGYRKSLGVKTAVGLVFERRFLKSKSTTTTNWAFPTLTETQILYAARDAWAAFKVYEGLASSGLSLERAIASDALPGRRPA